MTIATSRRWLARALTGAMFVTFLVGTGACGGAKSDGAPAPAEPTAEPAADPAPAAGDSMSPEDCERQGGRLVGDIGDGKAACNEGEKLLGRVRHGIEGGVCCAPGGAAGGGGGW